MPATFSTGIFIDAAPETVFRTMSDIENWRRWMPGLVSAEKLAAGPFGEGTEWREVRRMYGKDSAETFEVTGYEPPSSLRLRVDGSKGTTGKGEFLFEYRLEREGSGTRVRLTGEVRMPGAISKLFSRLMVGMFRKGCLKDLLAMKAYVESQARTKAAGR